MKKDDMKENIKEMIQKAGPARIFLVIVSGILLIVLSCGGFSGGSKEASRETSTPLASEQEVSDLQNYKEKMQGQVKDILEQVEGVGKVDVMITLHASREKVTLKDNVVNQEKREEESVLIEDENRSTSPYVVQEVEPQVEGILVVCGGGNQPAVQREIIAAISALFPVESHKIKVMKSKEAKE